MVDAPTELGVLAVEVDGRVEAAEFAEQVGAHQQIGRRQDEHVPDAVVLLLVDLARFDDRIDLAEPVHSQTDRLQHARIVPLDELRPDSAGVRPVQLLDHQTQRVGLRGDVVVAEQEEPVVTLDEPQHFVGCRAESHVDPDRSDECAGQALLDSFVDRLGTVDGFTLGDDEEEDAKIRVVLSGERVEGVVEPFTRVVHDDDRDDRRC